MARDTRTEKQVDPDDVAQAFARAIADGDFVSFRTIFAPFSPARESSTESFDDEKYAYLLPDDDHEDQSAFEEALAMVREDETWAHIQQELEASRPAQMPSNLLVVLADNAVRLGKYTSASQAYELLRIRSKTRDLFFEEADQALEAGDMEKAVKGYIIATSLDYDYSAFPEPLPKLPRHQQNALVLHGRYPRGPEDVVGLKPVEEFLSSALAYLLNDAEAAAKLDALPVPARVAFLHELIHQTDEDWAAFKGRFLEAIDMARGFEQRIRSASDNGENRGIEDRIHEQDGPDPMDITAHLLGRSIEGGEWWQYLKELAYIHPASVLFVSRQRIGEKEILIPRLRGDSPVVEKLGLLPPEDARQPADLG